MALGPTRGNIARLILGRGGRLLLNGTILDSATAFSLAHYVESLLYQVKPGDPLALSTSDPVSGHAQKPIAIEGVAYPQPVDHLYAGSGIVSAGFFRALNIPLLQGCVFTQDDLAGSMPVAIVNSTFAKSFPPPGNPLGHRFREGTNAWLTVVGCVPDLVYDAVTQYHQPVYYQPLTQRPSRSMVISLHGGRRAMDWARPLRTEVARLQPDLANYRVARAQALIARDTIGYYLASLLLGICGGGALFLAVLGSLV